MYVPNCVQEDLWSAEYPVYCQIDIFLFFQRLVPRGARMRSAQPGLVSDRLDCLDCNVALLAVCDKRVEVFGIIGTLHRNLVVREQHRVKIEALKTTPVH